MRLKGKRVITFAEKNFDDLEMFYPILRLREEGAVVDIAGPERNKPVEGKYGIPCVPQYAFSDIKASDYDGALVPGGWAPDRLRANQDVLRVIREIHAAKKPIGHICHAAWVLVSAGVLKGVKTTSIARIKDDLVNAGADWVDEVVVVDGNIIGSRSPDDLPFYVRAFADKLAEQ